MDLQKVKHELLTDRAGWFSIRLPIRYRDTGGLTFSAEQIPVIVHPRLVCLRIYKPGERGKTGKSSFGDHGDIFQLNTDGILLFL